MPFWVERTDKERQAHPLAVIFGIPVAFVILLALTMTLWSAAKAIGSETIAGFFGYIFLSKIMFIFFPKMLLAANLYATSLCLIAARLG